MSTGSVYALPWNWCGNLVWFINISIKNERSTRTSTLRVPRVRGLGEESREEDLDEFGRFDPLKLPRLEERTVVAFFVYHCLANLSSFTETILLVALFYLICSRPAGIQPLYGVIVASYPLGFLLGSVAFSMASRHELLILMFSRLRRATLITSLVNLVAWVACLTVFLNVYDDEYYTVLVLVLARFLQGVCGIQQVMPLFFLRHLVDRQYPQRDDLTYQFSRCAVGPSVALCLALGLPALSPTDYDNDLDPRQLFNVFTLPCWLSIAFVTTTLSYSLLLPTNYAFLVPDEAYMTRLAEQRDLLCHSRGQEAGFSTCRHRVLWADLLLNAVVYSLIWNLPFVVVRQFRYTIFQLYEPIFEGAAVALLSHPCLVAFCLQRYRVHKRFSAAANVLAVVLGTLSLVCCLLFVLSDFGTSLPLFASPFLLGYGMTMALGSIDSLGLDDDDNAEVSVAFAVRRRQLAKAAGRAVGTFFSGSLVAKTSAQGQCLLQYHEYWCTLLLVCCAMTLLCVLTTRQSGCRVRFCRSGVGGSPSLAQLDEMLLTQQRSSVDAVSCDPHSVCISLARSGLVVDIDVV